LNLHLPSCHFQCNDGFQQTLKMPLLVKEEGIEQDAADRLVSALREVPILERASIRRHSSRGDSRIDFILAIGSGAKDRRLVCQVRPDGRPRIAREACLELVDYARSDKRDYPVFIAPYISPDAAAICDEYQAGYFDLAGNCRLAFDRVYIRRESFPNPSVQKRDLRSLYSPKAERVLRVLLAAGKRNWRMQELADEAAVSLGQAANVKKLLLDREWIETDTDGLRIRSFHDAALPLLTEWAGNYRMERNTASEYYSLNPIPKTEAELAQVKTRLAFTSFSGAARFAPAVRYQRVTAYVLGRRPALVKRIGLKPVPSGGNVTLIEPYDEGVFYGTRAIEGAPVVSPVQLFLDLMQIKGRGEEAASAILEQAIKPLWR
jgi:hypothetical protein